jgi:hypothetical protein
MESFWANFHSLSIQLLEFISRLRKKTGLSKLYPYILFSMSSTYRKLNITIECDIVQYM